MNTDGHRSRGEGARGRKFGVGVAGMAGGAAVLVAAFVLAMDEPAVFAVAAVVGGIILIWGGNIAAGARRQRLGVSGDPTQPEAQLEAEYTPKLSGDFGLDESAADDDRDEQPAGFPELGQKGVDVTRAAEEAEAAAQEGGEPKASD